MLKSCAKVPQRQEEIKAVHRLRVSSRGRKTVFAEPIGFVLVKRGEENGIALIAASKPMADPRRVAIVVEVVVVVAGDIFSYIVEVVVLAL